MILVIDDDIGIRTSLSMMLRRARYEVTAVASPKEAMEVVRRENLQLIMLDMNFSLSTSGDEGLTLLRQIKLFRQDVPVILMTAWGSIGLAVKGMRAGAFDFITKPWNNAALMERIEVAMEISAHADSTKRSEAVERQSDNGVIVGASPLLLSVTDTIRRVAPTNAPVLITGESGTGKELIAEAVHKWSRRAGEPFVKVNLGGMSQSLFESEMFGYRKGAFTGAVEDRVGRFGMAHGGTIFLDEIGDLDLSSQVKLLRVLQDKTFEPLGDSRTQRVNVRVVCATNADLPQLIRDGRFREDLYYRINLITVHLPALRERKDDIAGLARHFIRKQCEENGLPQATLTADALSRLKAYSYPGNIRQLKNIVERAVLMSGNAVITADDIGMLDDTASGVVGTAAFGSASGIGGASAFRSDSVFRSASAFSGADSCHTMTLEEQERHSIMQAMQKYNGNISRVADALGLSRAALYRRLDKYDMRES